MKIIVNIDGDVQIREFYWTAPFTVAADGVLDLGETMRSLAGGELFFFDKSYDEPLQATLREKVQGLGADFYQWYSNFRQAG